MSDSSRPHRLQPTRLLRPRDFPGKSTGVGCHCLLQKEWWGKGKEMGGDIEKTRCRFTVLFSLLFYRLEMCHNNRLKRDQRHCYNQYYYYYYCILSLCLFNFYAEYIMRNVGLDEVQAGIKIADGEIYHVHGSEESI